jgi:hypothetical protein
VLTGAVAAITMTGAIYGAELKGTQELKKVRRSHMLRTLFCDLSLIAYSRRRRNAPKKPRPRK